MPIFYIQKYKKKSQAGFIFGLLLNFLERENNILEMRSNTVAP